MNESIVHVVEIDVRCFVRECVQACWDGAGGVAMLCRQCVSIGWELCI